MNEHLRQLVDTAIERLRAFEPKEGYHLAFSGGKDSCVIKHLADQAGVKYEAVYRVTGIDPPELVQFIKKNYPDVKFEFPRYQDGTRVTMWNLIPWKKMPPTRLVRYCCQFLKEESGDGKMTITGVRWAESQNRRANQGIVSVYGKKAGKELGKDVNFLLTNRGGGAGKRQCRFKKND